MKKVRLWTETSGSEGYILSQRDDDTGSYEYATDMKPIEGYFFSPQELEDMRRKDFRAGVDNHFETNGLFFREEEDKYVRELNIEK